MVSSYIVLHGLDSSLVGGILVLAHGVSSGFGIIIYGLDRHATRGKCHGAVDPESGAPCVGTAGSLVCGILVLAPAVSIIVIVIVKHITTTTATMTTTTITTTTTTITIGIRAVALPGFEQNTERCKTGAVKHKLEQKKEEAGKSPKRIKLEEAPASRIPDVLRDAAKDYRGRS